MFVPEHAYKAYSAISSHFNAAFTTTNIIHRHLLSVGYLYAAICGKIIWFSLNMPLFYQHNIDVATQLAIWRIEEPESFYLQKVPVKKEVAHPYKRLQHLAGRYLLPELFTDFPLEEIAIADTRKPFLPGEKYHFSISHCGNYAAAIASSDKRVGVDIEMVTPRLYDIVHKFLNAEEQIFLQEWKHITQVHLQLITILWSAKEAIYKWYGDGQMDFKRHMYLNGAIVFRSDEWIELPFMFDKEQTIPMKIKAKIFDPLVIAYVVGGTLDDGYSMPDTR